MAFRAEEILFSPTTRCNLACMHCNVTRTKRSLSANAAKRFLLDCKKNGINRIGFTGGEPFLAGEFLCTVVKLAAENGFLFTRIMTNGVWYKNSAGLKRALERLAAAGYDGEICVSVDAYHKQDVKKLAGFITSVHAVWSRPDVLSIAYVTGRDSATKRKLLKLARSLDGRLSGFGGAHAVIKRGGSLPYHIKIAKIGLSSAGSGSKLKDPWNGKWFREDLCKGPGNVFSVEPSGSVKPCCGYASELPALKVGDIRKDTVAKIAENIRQNRVVYGIFNFGLSGIRKRLAVDGVKFPGKTDDHCFFCHYILTKVPRKTLLASLKRLT